MIAEAENAGLAERLIEQSCLKQGIGPVQRTLHGTRRRGVPRQNTARRFCRRATIESDREELCDESVVAKKTVQ